MPHSRFAWNDRIKATEREYRAVRIALDYLPAATPDEIHDLTEERGWADLILSDAYAAGKNLDATYLIRMFSEFDRAVDSFWRSLSGSHGRDIDGRIQLDEVGAANTIPDHVILGAQDVRGHRNNLVHGRIDLHAAALAFADARANLLTYLRGLPEAWG